MRNLLITLLCGIISLSVFADRAILKKIPLSNYVVVGLEGGENIAIKDGYKVYNTFKNRFYVSLDTSKPDTNYIDVVRVTSSDVTLTNLVIKGYARHSYLIKNNLKLSNIIIQMPNRDNSNYLTDWNFSLEYNGVDGIPVVYDTSTGDRIMIPNCGTPMTEIESGTNYFVWFVEMSKHLWLSSGIEYSRK